MSTIYRIEPNRAYSGCIPTIVYSVQVLHRGAFKDIWVDVKSYESKSKAERLIKILKGEISLL